MLGTVRWFARARVLQRSLTLVRTIAPSHPKEISVLQFSPDGRRLAAGNHHMEIDLYAVPAFERLGTLRVRAS